MRSGECNVVSLYVLCCSVIGSVLYVACLTVFVILLLSVFGGALLDRTCTVFHRMCVLCRSSQ